MKRSAIRIAGTVVAITALVVPTFMPLTAKAATNCEHKLGFCQAPCLRVQDGDFLIFPDGTVVTVYRDGQKRTFRCDNGTWIEVVEFLVAPGPPKPAR